MRPFPLGSRPVPLAHLRRHPLIAAAAMIITAAAVSLITGCAAADEVAPPGANSSFQATVSGAIQAPLAGTAVLLALPSAAGSTGTASGRILGMADRASRTVVAFRWDGAAGLAPGSYPIGADTSSATMMYDTGTGAAGSTFGGVSGTLTITSATDQLVGGSYSVTARASDTGDQISVTGTFSAPVQAAAAD